MFEQFEAIPQKLGRIMESRLVAHIHTMAVVKLAGQARFNIAAEQAVEFIGIRQLAEYKFIMVASTIASTQESIGQFAILLILDFRLKARLADPMEYIVSI